MCKQIITINSIILCAFFATAVVSLEQKCLNSLYQKDKPGPEPDISATVCTSYTQNSCCNTTVAANITEMSKNSDFKWLSLRWDHCKPLSPRCQEFFVQEICFYECSPNLGPWLVIDAKNLRKQRFTEVPLCRKQCDDWYEACKEDETCVDNWSTMFKWAEGTNHCPDKSQCRKMREVFDNSPKAFCERIFDGSFQYVFDNQPCYAFSFTAAEVTVNDGTESWKTLMISAGFYRFTAWNSRYLFSLFWIVRRLLRESS